MDYCFVSQPFHLNNNNNNSVAYIYNLFVTCDNCYSFASLQFVQRHTCTSKFIKKKIIRLCIVVVHLVYTSKFLLALCIILNAI